MMSKGENPYQSPEVFPAAYADKPFRDDGLWRKGKLLVMHKNAALPPRCVKSNAPTPRTLRRKLTWHHPAVFIALLFNLLIYAILAIVLSKRATIYIGLSDRWFAKRRRAILIGWGSVLLAGGMVVGGIAMVENTLVDDWVGAVLIIGGLITFIAGAIFGLVGARMVTPTRITDDYVWLKGVHQDYLATLPDWPYNP